MRMTDRDKQVKGGGELKVNRACVNFMKLASIVLFAWGIACIAVGVSYLGEATIEVDDGDDGKTDFHVDVFFVVYGVFSLVPPTLFYCLKTAGKLKIAVSLFVSGSLVAYFFVGIIGAGHYSQHLGDIPRGIETIGVILYVPMGFSVAALAWLVFASRKRPPDSRNSGSASDSQTGRASTVNDEEIVVGADENQNEVDRSTKDPAYLDQNNFDDSTRSLLVEACGHDSLELARRSLQEETDYLLLLYRACLQTGNRPYHLAAAYGSKNVLAFLLDGCGGNPNQPNHIGNTALHYACMYGKTEIVDTLVRDYMAVAHKPGCLGNHPLHYAAKNGHLQIVRKLILEFNADANQKNGNGEAPLHLAAERGHLDVVKDLVEKHEAMENLTRNDGKAASDIAKEAGHVAVVDYLKAESMSARDFSNHNDQ